MDELRDVMRVLHFAGLAGAAAGLVLVAVRGRGLDFRVTLGALGSMVVTGAVLIGVRRDLDLDTSTAKMVVKLLVVVAAILLLTRVRARASDREDTRAPVVVAVTVAVLVVTDAVVAVSW